MQMPDDNNKVYVIGYVSQVSLLSLSQNLFSHTAKIGKIKENKNKAKS